MFEIAWLGVIFYYHICLEKYNFVIFHLSAHMCVCVKRHCSIRRLRKFLHTHTHLHSYIPSQSLSVLSVCPTVSCWVTHFWSIFELIPVCWAPGWLILHQSQISFSVFKVYIVNSLKFLLSPMSILLLFNWISPGPYVPFSLLFNVHRCIHVGNIVRTQFLASFRQNMVWHRYFVSNETLFLPPTFLPKYCNIPL